jgi:hypothetical protein
MSPFVVRGISFEALTICRIVVDLGDVLLFPKNPRSAAQTGRRAQEV